MFGYEVMGKMNKEETIEKGKPDKHDVFGMYLDNVWKEKGIQKWCPASARSMLESAKTWDFVLFLMMSSVHF